MFDHAKEKGVYDTLVKTELTEYLRDNGEAFDLIVSPTRSCISATWRASSRAAGRYARMGLHIHARARDRGRAMSTTVWNCTPLQSHRDYVEQLLARSGRSRSSLRRSCA